MAADLMLPYGCRNGACGTCKGRILAGEVDFGAHQESTLTEDERQLIRQRDFQGLIEAGCNIYFLLKIGAATGNGLYKMGAQMRGESYEQVLATRKIRGAV